MSRATSTAAGATATGAAETKVVTEKGYCQKKQKKQGIVDNVLQTRAMAVKSLNCIVIGRGGDLKSRVDFGNGRGWTVVVSCTAGGSTGSLDDTDPLPTTCI